MAKKNVQLDRAQAKAAKQKKLAIVLSGVLVLVLVFEVPKTLKAMHPKAAAPVVTADASAAPAAAPTTAAAASPSPAGASTPPAGTSASSASLVSSVPVSPDLGQLTQFTEFASKDPFDQTVQKTPAAGATTPATTPAKAKPASTPKAPPAPPPSSAVISLNGELMSVAVGSQFPTSGTVFSQIGSSLFELDSLTSKSAKVSIVGGSYASGAPSLTLTVGTPVTLQNTADGTRYTLLLEPPGTQVPATTTPTGASGTTSTTTTTATAPAAGTVVPSGSGG
jgi:hypothetical protein